MTREEAYIILNEQIDYPAKDIDIVNAIFDDFESRTCENCKHMENSGLGLFHYCTKIQHEVYGEYDDDSHMEDISVALDFGCNKFERKIDGDV